MKSRQIVLASRPVGLPKTDNFRYVAHLTQWVSEGKLKYKETIIKGFDELPDTFLGLFSGRNQGKMLVEVE